VARGCGSEIGRIDVSSAHGEAFVLTTFSDLGVAPETTEALRGLGITEPFPIQALAIPLAMDGHDLIGQARTGTGKTLAFGLPLLQRLTLPGTGRPQALVVAPTRELAIQVSTDLARAGKHLGARVLTVYGGRSYEPQVEALRAGVDVVVGTPGRLLDLARQRTLDLGGVVCLVLDEADEMLDLGFLPDVERILDLLAADRQTMLFSATMPSAVVALSRKYLRQPTHVRAEEATENRTVPTTAQHILRTHAMDKEEMLARVLQATDRGLAIVFCRTKRSCDKVAAELSSRGFAAAAVHGDLGQSQRERALRAFRAGKIDVMVATDVAARGIDVTGVTHVINYTCPEDEKIYLHRIGRTGRAGGSGTAITFVDWDDLSRWKMINDALELPFPDPPETYSTSELLYETLDIPASAGSRLPRAARTREGLSAEVLEDLGETGRTRSRRSPNRSEDAGPARPTRQRVPHVRRRTRGGRNADPAAIPGGTEAPATPATSTVGPPAAESADSAAGVTRPRRRRRRRGPGSSAAPEAASA
jgi:superfamily II DNA/RNA helicase